MATTALQPQTEKLNRSQAIHLLRRSGFGVAIDKVEDLIGVAAHQAADRLVDQARQRPAPPPPPWSQTLPPPRSADADTRQAYSRQARQWLRQYQLDWVVEMAQGGLREKMTLFWSNHFVTQAPRYGGSGVLAHGYLSLLRQHALEDFRTFVGQIGLNPAMLLYLDGARNQRRAPNENYARELLELFTVGSGNYTEADVLQIARALTGYRVDRETLESHFVPRRFDPGEKTIFGQSGPYDYAGVIELVFAERGDAIARFIAAKLYRFFVSATPDQPTVEALGGLLRAQNWQIAPVLAALFGSAHFYQEGFFGAQIKSPLDLVIGLFADSATSFDRLLDPLRTLRSLGQELFNPPDVAGWPGQRAWLSTTTLPLRWNAARSLLRANSQLGESLLALARRMPAPNNAGQLARDLARLWLAVPLPAAEEAELPAILLGDIPPYEWDIAAAGAATHLALYFAHITALPAYQLN